MGFGKPDAEKGRGHRGHPGLFWWDAAASQWSPQGITSNVNVTDNIDTAQVDHFYGKQTAFSAFIPS